MVRSQLKNADVVVVGAGISGIASAALLAKKGIKTALIERSPRITPALPESWLYETLSPLEKLGLHDKITTAFLDKAQVNFFSLDGKFSLKLESEVNHTSLGSWVRVNKLKFKELLLDQAKQLGVQVLFSTEAKEVTLDKAEIQLQSITSGEASYSSHKFLVDASGKFAFSKSNLNLPYEINPLDNRLGLFSHYEVASPLDITQMTYIALPEGYIFLIPLTENRLSIGAMLKTSTDTSPLEAIFKDTIGRADYVSNILKGSKQVLPVIPIINESRVCRKCAHDRVFVTGEAAAFFDPFFSSGINFALLSAELTADMLSSFLLGKEASFSDFESRFCQEMSTLIQETASSSISLLNHDKTLKSFVRAFIDPHLPYPMLSFLTLAQCPLERDDLELALSKQRESF
jgi:flavin-dependent dehydrogenase